MKKMIKKLMVVGIMAPFFVACSSEDADVEKSTLSVIGTNFQAHDVAPADLEGTWDIVSMISDTPVDLDFNGNTNTDLLAESDCFDNVYFDFNGAGTVSTGQAKLDFGADGSKFECEYGVYNAEYTVEGDQLVVTFVVSGMTVTQSKSVALSTDENGGEYLHVSLEDYEVAEFINDTENTVISEVGTLEMIYKKR